MMYDPPSGWKYGFPKPYKPLPGEPLADTLLRDGYPKRLVEQGMDRYCRFITSPSEIYAEVDHDTEH